MNGGKSRCLGDEWIIIPKATVSQEGKVKKNTVTSVTLDTIFSDYYNTSDTTDVKEQTRKFREILKIKEG